MVSRFMILLPNVHPYKDSRRAKYRTLRIPAKKGNVKGLSMNHGMPVASAIAIRGMEMIAPMIKVPITTIMLSITNATSLLIQ